jgi:hypothetical protein
LNDTQDRVFQVKQADILEGEAENRLFELAEQNRDIIETVVIKCAYVVPKESMMPDLVVGLSRNAIRVDELGAAMIYCALDRHVSETVGNT